MIPDAGVLQQSRITVFMKDPQTILPSNLLALQTLCFSANNIVVEFLQMSSFYTTGWCALPGRSRTGAFVHVWGQFVLSAQD